MDQGINPKNYQNCVIKSIDIHEIYLESKEKNKNLRKIHLKGNLKEILKIFECLMNFVIINEKMQ